MDYRWVNGIRWLCVRLILFFILSFIFQSRRNKEENSVVVFTCH